MKSMMKRRAVLAVLIGMSIYACDITAASEVAYAAEASNVHDAVAKEKDSYGYYDPAAFSERIKKILDEYSTRKITPEIRRAESFGEAGEAKQTKETAANIAVSQPSVSSPAPQPAMPEKRYKLAEGRYNFDWQGTPIAQSIYAVAKVAHKDIVVNGTLSGKVYVSLHNTTCENALQVLSSAFNFNWMVDGDTIIVSTSSLMQQSRVFDVHYISDMEKLSKELQSLGLDESNIYTNPETRTVSATGTPYQLMQVERRLQQIDKPISQCLVLAQLIEINHGDKLDLGMQYSLPTYSHTASNSSGNSSFSGNFLEKLTFSASSTANKSLSKGKVVSRPMIMVMNGQEGIVNFGDQVPVLSSTSTSTSTSVTADYKDVGTRLVITPSIDDKTGVIGLKINAEVSSITSWISSGQVTAPQISTRRATTSAQLKSGQSFVIGGLMSVKELDNLSGIPGLMNLPILGELFKFHSHSKEYSEIYIMITPYIVSDDINPREILRQAGDKIGS